METDFFNQMVLETLAHIDEKPLDETIQAVLEKHILLDSEKVRSYKQLVKSEICGFGPITDFLNDPYVTEICINSFSEIFIEKSGMMEKTNMSFVSSVTYERFIKNLLLQAEKTADTRHPIADGYLPDGSRLNICLPPLSAHPIVTIRKHTYSDRSLADLVKSKMLSQDLSEKLRSWIKERKNVLVCGPTGSGKTTLLRAALKECGGNERIITLEDTSEIGRLNSQHVNLLTRVDPENLVPNIDLSMLVKNALRMRPDRLVVGEVRGVEALYLLDALSTGHRGSLCTLHAHTAQHALKRLESLISRAAPRWEMMAIRQMIFDSIDVVIVCENQRGLRKICQTAFVSGIENFGYLLDSQEY